MQWEELSAGLQAYEAENKALHSSIEQSKQELRGTEDEEQRIKQAFLHACSLLNANFRCAYHASVPTTCSSDSSVTGKAKQMKSLQDHSILTSFPTEAIAFGQCN